MTEKIDLSRVEILPNLPAIFGPERGHPLPAGLKGSTVLNIGMAASEADVSGGGLVIDYSRPGSKKKRRVVLAFNELGMWVVYQGQLRAPATRA
jgi:hypothetical protein